MATHSSILAWRIPWTEEPGRFPVHGVTKGQTQTHRRRDRILGGGTRTHTRVHTHAHMLPTSLEDGGVGGAGLVLGHPLGGLPCLSLVPSLTVHRYIRGPRRCPLPAPRAFWPPRSHRSWGPFSCEATGVQLGFTIMEEMTPEKAVQGAGQGARRADMQPPCSAPPPSPISLRRCCGKERPLLGGTSWEIIRGLLKRRALKRTALEANAF